MRKVIVLCVMVLSLAVPVQAVEFTAPEAPEEAQRYMPSESSSFGEDLWYVIKEAAGDLQPSIVEAAGICLGIIAVVLLVSILKNYSDTAKKVADLTGTLAVGLLLMQPVNALIQLGAATVEQISEYGKLLLPVMTAAMAAQGATATSGALYTATAFFDALLSSAISQLLIPLLYVYLCVSIAYSTVGDGILDSIRKLLKWLMTWGLKIILYVFTGYISITGVVGGATDAALLKAAKITISGAVPVVGGILSDASEAILVSAGVVKNSAGIYGLLAIAAIAVGPFLQIGLQYLMLKLTGGICSSFQSGSIAEVIKDFTGAMGLVLAMTGTVCLLLLISLVCFMKGVG